MDDNKGKRKVDPNDPRIVKIRAASTRDVTSLSDNEIKRHFNLSKEVKYCTLGSMDNLCRALGLSYADRAALSQRLTSMGLKPPR